MLARIDRGRWQVLLLVLMLPLAGCAAAPAETAQPDVSDPPVLGGPWYVEFIGDHPVVDRSPAHFLFADDGGVSGSASCNRYTGSYEISGDSLAFGVLATTRRLCVDALNEQEQRFLAAVPRVAAWRLEQGLLVMSDDRGGMLFRAARHEPARITGTAHYLQRIALPPGAVFTASLQDVSRMDVAAETLASTNIENPGSVPIAFEIAFDPGQIDERMTYSVRAEIRVDGALWATTDTQYPVLTRGAGREVEVLLRLTR